MIYAKKYIIFVIQVPILLVGPSFDAYRVEVIPTPVHSSDGVAQSAYTVVADMPDYLAISKDGSKFLQLTYEEYYYCIE